MAQKVLFTASTLSHIRSFHLPYLAEFRRLGWTVHVACGGTGTLSEVDRLLLLPFRKKITAPENLKAAAILRQLICQEEYDLIITHTSLAAFFTRLALKGSKCRPKLINMVHGYLFDENTPPLKRGILLTAEKATAAQTDLLLTMNAFDHALAQQYRLAETVVNLPGVGVNFKAMDAHAPFDTPALRRKLGIRSDAFVFLYAAEFSARKSHATLLRAMQQLPERTVLVLAGSGDKQAECIALAQSLHLDDRVIFPGHVSPMSVWYAMADAAVSASRSEGLPFNIMEAMHMQLPVVASAVKGHSDLIRDGENGLLFPYGDVAACAGQMQRLVNDPTLCRSLGSAALASSARYSLDNVLPQVMEAYLSLLPSGVQSAQ